MTRISDTLTKAETLADWYRGGELAWNSLTQMLADKGFYGITRRGRYVVAYLDGVRFEL